MPLSHNGSRYDENQVILYFFLPVCIEPFEWDPHQCKPIVPSSRQTMRHNIRTQPSDRQVPFNYLVIQSPEDTSVGKSSTFPWRDRKEDVAH